MNTKLQQLKKQYPGLDYQDGFFYATPESDDVLFDNANEIIQDHFNTALNVQQTDLTISEALEAEFNLDFSGHDRDESFNVAFQSV